MIASFFGKYRFLSNFYVAPVFYDDIWWLSTEHAYQAAKTHDFQDKMQIMVATTCYEAKKLGSKVQLRLDWDLVKDQVMYDVCLDKFTRYPDLRQKLIATWPHELVEGNTWGDTYWGVCNGVGKNQLGYTLMQIRKELMSDGETKCEMS